MSLREMLRKLLRGQRVSVVEAARLAPSEPGHEPGDCPLPDCSTRQPSAPPLDVFAEQQRCAELEREVGHVAWWLLDAFPEVWHRRPLFDRIVAAERVTSIRRRVRAERRVAL